MRRIILKSCLFLFLLVFFAFSVSAVNLYGDFCDPNGNMSVDASDYLIFESFTGGTENNVSCRDANCDFDYTTGCFFGGECLFVDAGGSGITFAGDDISSGVETHQAFVKLKTGANDGYFPFYVSQNARVRAYSDSFIHYVNGGSYGTTAYVSDEWYLVVQTIDWDDDKASMYVYNASDGNLVMSDINRSFTDLYNGFAFLTVGTEVGVYDELYIYEGNVCPTTAEPVPTTYFDITANRTLNGSELLVFNASIVSVCDGVVDFSSGAVLSTTNGTINTGINQSSCLSGISSLLVQADNHFNWSTTDLNVSVDLQVNLSRFPIVGVFNFWNGSGLKNWNVTIQSVSYSDSGAGYVYVPLNQSGVSLTYYKDDYVSKSYTDDLLADSTINNSLFQANLSVRAFEIISNNQISDSWTVVDDDSRIWNLSSGVINIYPNLGNYTWNFLFDDYYNFTNVEVEVDSSVDAFNLTNVYNHKLTFTAESLVTGGAINTFTINLSTYNNSFTETLSTTTGSVVFNLSTNFSYASLIDAEGFAFSTFNHSFTNFSSSFIYELFTTNSLNLSFYDSSTGILLNGTNVSIDFVGATSFSDETVNGTLYVDLLSPSEYTLIFSGYNNNTDTTYRQNQYILSVSNRSSQSLSLYLQPENTSTLILVTVSDKFGNLLQGADVTVQRYIDGDWVTEQILRTDFQGRTEGSFVLSTVFYNFLIEYEGTTYFGVLNSNPDKKIIYAEDVVTGLNFFINLLSDSVIGSVNNKLGVLTNLSFVDTSGNNTIGYFRFFYDDPDNTDRTACLVVTKGFNDVVCSCASNQVVSESSILTCSVNQTSDKAYYRVSAFIDDLAVEGGTWLLGFDERIDWGLNGYFIGFFILLLCIVLFVAVPSLSIIVGSIAFIALSLMGVMFADLRFGAYIVLLLIAWIIAGIRSRSGVNG